jgi:hypothetical protein
MDVRIIEEHRQIKRLAEFINDHDPTGSTARMKQKLLRHGLSSSLPSVASETKACFHFRAERR